jgi:hypothetical protein
MMGESGMVMGYWSAWHWIVFVASAALLLYPIGRILNRIGFSPLWAVVAVIPLANVVGLWIVALAAWPRDKGGAS